jgi:hypothetical protein
MHPRMLYPLAFPTSPTSASRNSLSFLFFPAPFSLSTSSRKIPLSRPRQPAIPALRTTETERLPYLLTTGARRTRFLQTLELQQRVPRKLPCQVYRVPERNIQTSGITSDAALSKLTSRTWQVDCQGTVIRGTY